MKASYSEKQCCRRFNVVLAHQHSCNIKGDYKDGQLHGRAKIVYSEGHSIDGYFKEGVLHGFARFFDEVGRLSFLGNHRNGRAEGTCWKVIKGGGGVVGEVKYADFIIDQM